jgi:hypothetical protein
MCVIIDANRAGIFFSAPVSDDYKPVVRWITERHGRLIYGGRLEEELQRLRDAVRTLRQWSLAGQAVRVEPSHLTAEEDQVRKSGLCRSNDSHVIALARFSGARVLCTDDRTLMRDFRNPSLIDNPRGSIYQNRSHAHLLDHSGSCGYPPRRKRH